MNHYAIFIQNRETKAWESQTDDEAKSRRAFIRQFAETIKTLRGGKYHWKVRAI